MCILIATTQAPHTLHETLRYSNKHIIINKYKRDKKGFLNQLFSTSLLKSPFFT